MEDKNASKNITIESLSTDEADLIIQPIDELVLKRYEKYVSFSIFNFFSMKI